MNEPHFLVEAQDGRLYPYQRPDLLKIDLVFNTEPPRRLYRLDRSALIPSYEPVDISDYLPESQSTQAEPLLPTHQPLQLQSTTTTS